MAPSYIAAIAAILVNLQGLLGLDFLPDQWVMFLTVGFGIVIAIRQILTGRSTVVGKRPN